MYCLFVDSDVGVEPQILVDYFLGFGWLVVIVLDAPVGSFFSPNAVLWQFEG